MKQMDHGLPSNRDCVHWSRRLDTRLGLLTAPCPVSAQRGAAYRLTPAGSVVVACCAHQSAITPVRSILSRRFSAWNGPF